MFRLESDGHYRSRLCTAIPPFWFSMEHHWIVIAPFWLSNDDILFRISPLSIKTVVHHVVQYSFSRFQRSRWINVKKKTNPFLGVFPLPFGQSLSSPDAVSHMTHLLFFRDFFFFWGCDATACCHGYVAASIHPICLLALTLLGQERLFKKREFYIRFHSPFPLSCPLSCSLKYLGYM